MNAPTLITAAQLCAYLDDHPAVEARAFLARGRILKAREILSLCIWARAPRLRLSFVRATFAALVDRIMLRWALERSPARPTKAQLKNRGETPEGGDSLVGRPGGLSNPRLLSSSRPAGEASRLPAGPEEAAKAGGEWTFTRRADGRIVMEERQ